MVKKGYYGDYKTQLQEIIQKNPDDHVSYQILAESGPDHDKTFEAQVSCDGKVLAKKKRKSKNNKHGAANAYLPYGIKNSCACKRWEKALEHFVQELFKYI